MPNPIKKIPRLALSLLVLTALGASPLRAQKLIDLIPGLYGGDGILLATAEAASHTAHFSIGSAASINRLNQQIAAEVGGFPVSSAVGGFSFEFDPVLGDFVSTAESLGPIMAERAEGIGKGGFNLNLSFTHFSYDRFSGFDLGRFAVVARHDPDIIGFPDVRDQFEEDVLRIDMDLDIDVRLVALAANYGLSESAEIGFLLPYAAVDMQVRSKARIDEGSGNSLFAGIHSFDPEVEAAEDRVSGSSSGIGDLILRGKHSLPDWWGANAAAAILLQLGTADAEDFLGTGDTALRPYIVLSRPVGKGVTPHLNIGYEHNFGATDQSALEYVVGFDWGKDQYSLAVELVGSHELDGDGIGDDIVDAALGAKWNPWGQVLLAYNLRLPLNDAGLRPTVVSTLSLEYDF